MAVNMDASEGTAVEESGGREVRSTVVMTGLRFGGKMLGLLKTLVIAAAFGASGALDAFWVAYMLPMLMPGLILGVVTTAFIPSFMRTAKNGAEEVDWRGLNTLFTLVTVLVFAATALVWLGRMQLVKIMAPGMSPEVHALAAQLTGTMAIAVFIFGINSILSAILQALHRFAVMSLESIITNVFIIAGAILLSRSHGVHGLVWSVIAGFGVHMLLLIWATRDIILRKLRPAFDITHVDFTGSAAHMLPLFVGFFGSISMTIIDRMFVSTLDEGAISVLVYAGMIALLPMEVFGHAVFTAFYPGLSRDHAAGRVLAMRDAQVRGMRLLLFVLLPATVMIVIGANALITLLLERGAFTAEAGRLTAATMAALALGLPFRAVNYFNFRVFHARREPWTAVFIGLFGVSLNIVLDILMIGPFGVIGIAFATSIAMLCCSIVSTLLLQRRQRASIVRPMLRPVGKLITMTAVFAVVALALLQIVGIAAADLVRWQRLMLELSVFVPAGAAFLFAGHILGFEEARTMNLVAARALQRG
ncbi:MAG TPA: murein biosynthesis integral membrane protein MurJ [Gammaproteobacteria bacterium]|nr:murein biosynthesis integral membrane protein MurJ [Gammaproteobacteria bacterium]